MKTKYNHKEVTKLLNSMESVANNVRNIRIKFQNAVESKSKKAA